MKVDSLEGIQGLCDSTAKSRALPGQYSAKVQEAVAEEKERRCTCGEFKMGAAKMDVQAFEEGRHSEEIGRSKRSDEGSDNDESEPSQSVADEQEEDLDQENESDSRETERKSSSSNLSSQSSIGPPNAVSDDGVEIPNTTGSSFEVKDDEPDPDSLSEFLDNEGRDVIDVENNDETWSPPEPAEDEEKKVEEADQDSDEDDYEEGGWGPASPGSASDLDLRKSKGVPDEHRRAIRAQVDVHFRSLVAQLLHQENIDLGEEGNPDSWLEIASSLSWEAANYIKPDRGVSMDREAANNIKSDKGVSMDPGYYVKIKCIASGQPSDSVLVKGVVCRRNVAHKRMTAKFRNPKVLLLGGALEYQRVSGQLSSLDTLIHQEKEHLRMTVSKIESYHPNVLLVEKTVSRYAQDALLEKDITLVLNVKKPVLERIARCLGTEVVLSPDDLHKAGQTGTCDIFRVEKYEEVLGSAGQQGKPTSKFLMFFDGCPKPQGCTILLKGANGDELKKIKHVMTYTVFAAYHLGLETSFLADEGATFSELSARSPLSSSRAMSRNSSMPGFLALPPVRFLEQHGAVSPLPAGALAPVRIPPSASSSRTTSATTSPVSSPAHTTLGFQTGMIRGFGPAAFFPTATGTYPGGYAGQGARVLSSLTKDGLSYNGEKDTAGFLVSDSITGGTPAFPDADSAAAENSASSSLAPDGPHLDRDDVVSEMSGRRLQVDIPDSCPSYTENDGADFPPDQGSRNREIVVQLSTTNSRKQSLCIKPHFLRIQFYGYNDRPLGSFIRNQLFSASTKCKECDEVNSHNYCFTHRSGSLTISVRKISSDKVLTGEKEGKIWMWHRCKKCPLKQGVPPATHRVVMSDAAWGLSFGKFLELSFSNHEAASRVAACGHSLHKHHLRFYGFGSLVACFRYADIKLNSVYLPPLQLDFIGPLQEEWLRRETDEVKERVGRFFVEVMNRLTEVGVKVQSSSLGTSAGTQELRRSIKVFQEMHQKEQAEFQEILDRACPPDRCPGQPYADILQLNYLRRRLIRSASVWASRLHMVENAVPPKTRINHSIGDLVYPEVGRDHFLSDVNANAVTKPSDTQSTQLQTSSSVPPEFATLTGLVKENELPSSGDLGRQTSSQEGEVSGDAGGPDLSSEKDSSTLTKDGGRGDSPSDKISEPGEDAVASHQPISASAPEGLSLTNGLPDASSGAPDHSVTPGSDLSSRRALSEGSYPLLADLSDNLATWSGEESAAQEDKVDSSGDQVVQAEKAKEEDVYEVDSRSGEPQSMERSTSQVSLQSESQSMDRTPSQVSLQGEPESVDRTPSQVSLQGEPESVDRTPSQVSLPEGGMTKPEKVDEVLPSAPSSPQKHKPESSSPDDMLTPLSTKSFSRTSSNASTASTVRVQTQGTSSAAASLYAPQEGDPRFLDVGQDDMVVAVYDDEVTSLIAYAISTEEHYAYVTDGKDEKDAIERQNSEILHPLQPSGGSGDCDTPYKASASFLELMVNEAIENPLTSTKASQMVKKTITFSDDSPQGKVKFSVVCYFAKQFDALRKKSCSGNANYIRSLSRCKKWGAQGGKSNVFFAKTADDRFVVKQVTRTELNSFLEFAPHYFKYLFEALTAGNPTCLAKILGVYEVKVIKGGKETKMDVIVMENLLFGRRIKRLYDLKGSKRSRYAQVTEGGANQVLLDSNLLELMPTSPIFVGNKSKKLLERAVWNDTYFLSNVLVMDYSLLVGVDEEKRELVVGIIDFMRQYTWDKHLETWVKASGILGGPNAPPTVISPKQYKKRFRTAMATYFLMVPDDWSCTQSTLAPTVGANGKGSGSKQEDAGEEFTISKA
ncbi:hypothetical protein R1sor_009675 [Riccia sorocarpa]|uniref:1-phosphatidylinositol-3-phosphate 5-kinase n=1 Tax=Riccia sorocarpa TaxID=122646 RepID=A0ABD3I1W4_9MARC